MNDLEILNVFSDLCIESEPKKVKHKVKLKCIKKGCKFSEIVKAKIRRTHQTERYRREQSKRLRAYFRSERAIEHKKRLSNSWKEINKEKWCDENTERSIYFRTRTKNQEK